MSIRLRAIPEELYASAGRFGMLAHDTRQMQDMLLRAWTRLDAGWEGYAETGVNGLLGQAMKEISRMVTMLDQLNRGMARTIEIFEQADSSTSTLFSGNAEYAECQTPTNSKVRLHPYRQDGPYQPATVSSPSGANLRTGPGTEHTIVVGIPYGTNISIDPTHATDAGTYTWVPAIYTDPLKLIPQDREGFLFPMAGALLVDYSFGAQTDYNTALTGDWDDDRHPGIDCIPSGLGTEEVVASAPGTVVASGWDKGYGNHVVVEYSVDALPAALVQELGLTEGQSIYIMYAHLSNTSILPDVGTALEAGTTIGIMGNTGNSDGPHLHMEMRVGATGLLTGELPISGNAEIWYDPTQLNPVDPSPLFPMQPLQYTGWIATENIDMPAGEPEIP